MPVILAIIGALGSGLTYWFVFGNGQEVLASWMRDRRDAKRRAIALDVLAKAPVRAITDTRDAAIVLMITVARIRGEMTPEQESEVKKHIVGTLDLAAEIEKRIALGKFAYEQTQVPIDVVEGVKTLLASQLGSEGQIQLKSMLEDVARVHGGPTEAQVRFIETAVRLCKPLN